MFKRATKIQPPSPPEFSEILEDLETFHVEKPLVVKTRNFENSTQSSLLNQDVTQFWNLFETFISDVDDLKRIKTEINGFKLQLESNKFEIDTISKNMKINIEQNLDEARNQQTSETQS